MELVVYSVAVAVCRIYREASQLRPARHLLLAVIPCALLDLEGQAGSAANAHEYLTIPIAEHVGDAEALAVGAHPGLIVAHVHGARAGYGVALIVAFVDVHRVRADVHDGGALVVGEGYFIAGRHGQAGDVGVAMDANVVRNVRAAYGYCAVRASAEVQLGGGGGGYAFGIDRHSAAGVVAVVSPVKALAVLGVAIIADGGVEPVFVLSISICAADRHAVEGEALIAAAGDLHGGVRGDAKALRAAYFDVFVRPEGCAAVCGDGYDLIRAQVAGVAKVHGELGRIAVIDGDARGEGAAFKLYLAAPAVSVRRAGVADGNGVGVVFVAEILIHAAYGEGFGCVVRLGHRRKHGGEQVQQGVDVIVRQAVGVLRLPVLRIEGDGCR